MVFHEPINPRAGNFEMCVQAARDAGELELANELEHLQTVGQWADYAVAHLQVVQELGEEMELPIHLWPDKSLVKHTEPPVAEWLQEWRDRQSPEEFGGRNTPDEPMPELP